jgi:hypothetical protein
MRKAALGVVAIVAAVGLGELAAAGSGLVDIPLYEAPRQLGYVPKANQHGSFLHRFDWAFNEHHMGVAEPFEPTSGEDILLVGDSVVFGGVRMPQAERLGPTLERLTSSKVWPISAKSWSLTNELTYLYENPDVTAGVDRMVIVLNGSDFRQKSIWESSLTHPLSRPLFSTLYLAEKFVLGDPESPPRPSLSDRTVRDRWHRFVRSFGKPVTVVLYPEKHELEPSQEQAVFAQRQAELEMPGVTVVRLGKDERWRASATYLDHIHPDARGTYLLAEIIAAELEAETSPDQITSL